MQRHNIKQWFSLPYNPRANGSAERAVGIISRMWSLYKHSTGELDWPKQLPQFCHNYNKTWNQTLGKSPNQVLAEWDKTKESDPQTVERLKHRFTGRQKQKKGQFNISTKLFKKGELVRLRLGALGRGLKKNATLAWSRDPFEVVEVHQSTYGPDFRRTRYRIKDKDGSLVDHLYYNDMLTPYVKPEREIELPEQWIIDFIKKPAVYRRKEANGKWTIKPGYVVKWIGGHDDTIERRDVLIKDVPKLIETFDKKHQVKWRQNKRDGWAFTWKQ